jgi:hypothetical protein
MTTPDTSAVERALADVAKTQAELNELELALADRTSELTDQILLLGMDLHGAGVPADPDLVRRLYWGAASLSTQAIYEAFGLRSPNDVSTIAGPGEFRLPCKDCGTILTHQVNRTQLARLRANNRCEACATRAAERERQHRAELETQWRRRQREDDEAVRRAMEAYVLANPDLPEEPTGALMYVEIPVPEWGGTTVRLRDLTAVRADLRNRLTR